MDGSMEVGACVLQLESGVARVQVEQVGIEGTRRVRPDICSEDARNRS
uniref:Uncharacterized protein n=1 Tax=Peronospora matthiolae TaxID=2874970 RepID=A0AAV1UNX1_9STRA